MNKTFSIGESYSRAWAVFKENAFFLIGATLLTMIVSSFFSYLAEGPYKGIEPTEGILSLIGLFMRIWLNFNLLVVTIRILDGVKPEWQELFVWRDEMLSYMGASILYFFIIFLGCLLFIIPGLYFAIKYSLYGFLIADKRLGAFDALKKSGEVTSGVKWLLIGFGLVSTGVAFLGVLAFGVGILVALPVISLALALVYRSLSQEDPVSGEESSETPVPLAVSSVRGEVSETNSLSKSSDDHTG